jgi:hypothetical protein
MPKVCLTNRGPLWPHKRKQGAVLKPKVCLANMGPPSEVEDEPIGDAEREADLL